MREHTSRFRLASQFQLGCIGSVGIVANLLLITHANADMKVDLRATQVNGVSIAPTKFVYDLHEGDRVTIETWVEATGQDPTKFECVQDLGGSFLSSKGGMLGNLSVTGIPSPWAAIGSAFGSFEDLDGDGDNDIGSNSPTDDIFAIRSSELIGPHSTQSNGSPYSSLLAHSISGGTEYMVATLQFVVTSTGLSQSTQINMQSVHLGSVYAFWSQDCPEIQTPVYDDSSGELIGTYTHYSPGSVHLYEFGGGDNGDFSIGAPITLFPEPSAIALLAVAGGSIALRRRCRCG